MSDSALYTRVEKRVEAAYAPPPNFKRIQYTTADARALNLRLRTYYLALSERRENLIERGVNSFVREVKPQMDKWLKNLASDRYAIPMAEHAMSLYNAGKTRTSTDAEVRAFIHDSLADDDSAASTYLDDLLIYSFADARIDMNPGLGALHYMQGLFDFQATEGLQNTFKYLKHFQTLLYITKATTATLTPADALIVDIIFGKQFPEVLDSIKARQNLITAVSINNAEFTRLRNTIKRELYEKMEGGAGAQALSRKLQKDMLKKYGKKFASVTKDRYLLWARTEGATIQNDALMRLGAKAHMDGKIWQDIGDSKVRDGTSGIGDHVSNGTQGVIPVGSAFPDGSMDGGFGSVSPWNCRCVVGPALLTVPSDTLQNKPIYTSDVTPPASLQDVRQDWVNEVKSIHDLETYGSLPKDSKKWEYYYHSVRRDSDIDSILNTGIKPGNSNKVYLSKDEIRDRGSGAVIVRVPTGTVTEGIDFVERGLQYREFTVPTTIPSKDIIKPLRVVTDKTGFRIREDELAAHAAKNQGITSEVLDLPEQYHFWFRLLNSLS